MGANESAPVRNMDKRTARREYKDDFERAIMSMRRSHPSAAGASRQAKLNWENGNIRVCVRKRPIFAREQQGGEFDVVSCPTSKSIVVHDARMHTDMKRQFINNHEFEFDRVFDDKTSNASVYEIAASPLVNIAVQGGYATCMVYGQTGSGTIYFYELLILEIISFKNITIINIL